MDKSEPKINKEGTYSSYGDGVKYNGNEINKKIKNNNDNRNKPFKINKANNDYGNIKKSIENNKNISPINWFDNNGYNEVVENLSKTKLFVGGGTRNKVKQKINPETDAVQKQVYGNLRDNNFFENIHTHLDSMVKEETGRDLQSKVIKMNSQNIMTNKSGAQRNLVNFEDMKNNFDELSKIIKEGGQFTVFDMEANSGINKHGHSILTNITELASVTYEVDAITKKAREAKVFNTALGYTNKEYDEVKKTLKSLSSKSKDSWTVDEKVLFDRMNIYSESEFKGVGFEQQVIKAKGIEDIITSNQKALEGAKKLRKVALDQEEWMKSQNITSSYETVRTNYMQRFRDNLADTLAVGHNIQGYDIPMLNRMTDSTRPIKALDTYQTALYAQEGLGRSSIYGKDGRVAIPKGYGPGTQTALTQAHGLKNPNAAAHIAINDVRENALLMLGEMHNPTIGIDGTINISDNTYFNKIMSPNMEAVNKQLSKTGSKYTGKDQVFFMDHTTQKNFGDKGGALSFEYDPMTDEFKTFDGYKIGRNRQEIENAGYPAFGPRKGALYQHELFEMEVNENFKKQFMNLSGSKTEAQAEQIFQEYATAGKVYITKSREYMDLDELTKKLGSKELAEHYYKNRPTTYSLETRKDRVGANLGINVGTVANEDIYKNISRSVTEDIKDPLTKKVMQTSYEVSEKKKTINKGGIIPNEEAIRGLNFKRTEIGIEAIVKDAGKVDSSIIINNLVDKSSDRTINDSAARKIRNLDYKKIVQLRSYQNKLKEVDGIQGVNPVITKISQMVSQNKDIKLIHHEEIINALGWHDYTTKTDKIVKETVNNVLAMDAHVMKMSPLIDTITEMLDDKYGQLDLSSPEAIARINNDSMLKEVLYKKDFEFKQLYNNYIDYTANGSIQGNNAKATYHTAAEMNKIDFNSNVINPTRNKVGGWAKDASSEVTSINLESPNSLLNTFYNGRFAKLNDIVNKDGNAGIESLKDAYHTIRSDKRFRTAKGQPKIFDGIDINSYQGKNIAQLNDVMMEELKGFASKARTNDSSWGYMNPRLNQDIVGPTAIVDMISKQSKDSIKSKLTEFQSNLPDDIKLLGGKDHKEAVDELVNEYFLSFKKSDLQLSGHTKEQKAYTSKQYDIAKRTATNKADSLLKGIKGTDIQLAMTQTKDGSILSLIQGDMITNLEDMFRFNHTKGMLTTQVGQNEYALKLGLGRFDELDKSSFGLTNTAEKITRGKLDHINASWAIKRNESVVDAIAFNTRSTASALRDASAMIDINNGQLFSQGFQFDANEMIAALPDLKDTISKIEKDFNINDSAKAEMKNMMKKIEKDPKFYANKGFSKILPVELNFFTDEYMAPLLESIINKKGDFTEAETKILQNVNFDSKNEAFTKGNLAGVENYYIDPLAKMDDDKRPPVTQMQNTRLYDKKGVEEGVTGLKESKEIYKKLNATSVYTSDNMEKFIYNNTSSTGRASTNGLTMKYMQIDSYSLRNQFLDEGNKTKMGKYIEDAFGGFSKNDMQRAKEVIHDRAKRLSTYEQQSSMDARVHDINFHKSNDQLINAKKKMIANHQDNLDLIKYVDGDGVENSKLHFIIGKDGKIEYDIGVKVKQGQYLGTFGNDKFSQDIHSKINGMFRGRYFDSHGNVVSEDILQGFLKDSKVDLTNNDAILKKLDSTFKFKYQIQNMEEMHGAKAFLGASEKTTIDSMKLGIGEIDKGLANRLKEAGFNDVLGKVLDKDYLDDTFKKQLIGKFGETEAGSIMDKIYNERYAFSDSVHSLDMFKDTTFITTLDTGKHSSATVLMHNALNELRYNEELNTENLDKIFGKGTYEILGENSNVSVKIGTNLSKINMNFDKERDEALFNAFNADTRVYDKNGKSIGHTGVGHLISVVDDSAGTVSGVFDGEVKGKGVKFSDAMGRNLDRQTYNTDGLNKVYEHHKKMGTLSEFESVYGHALDEDSFKNGKLAFNSDYSNKSMASPVTETMRKRLIKKDYDPSLESVAENEQYEHLNKWVKEGRSSDISVKTAENMYSYERGLEAMEMNSKNTPASVERYMNQPDYKAFKQLDWSVDSPEYMDLQVGGQGRTVVNSEMNPYTNNFVIKTGLGGDSEYLALPRMPEVHTGDSLVQKKHQDGLLSLQQKMKGYKANPDEKSRAVLESHIKGMKTQLISDVDGKEGLIKNLTQYRMDQSFMGKGSGIISAAFDKDNNTLFGGDVLGIEARTAALDNANADIFKTASFNGKSLNRHYAEGKVIDSLFMSEDAFRGMGYFDEKYMNTTIGSLNKETVNSLARAGMETNEDKMKHLLRTQGDAFVSVRYPEIMQGSDKFTMGYLDDTLKSNEMKVLGPTGMSAKLDFDGDQMNAARITTEDGLSRLNAVTGKNLSFGLVEQRDAIDSSIMTRAVTDNAYWEDKVQNFMTGAKGFESNSKAMDMREIARHKLIDGVAYIGGNDYSELERKNLSEKYSSTLDEMAKKENKFQVDGVRDDKLLKADIFETYGKESDEAMDEFVAAKAWRDRNEMIKAKSYHNAIGETNVTNQKIKSIISGLLPKDTPDYEYQSNLMFDFLYQSEEAAISSKSSIAGLSSDRARQWNSAVSDLMQGKGDRAANLGKMEVWLNENIKGNMASGLYYSKSDSFANRMAEDFGVYSLDDFNGLSKANSAKVDDMLIKDILSMTESVSEQTNSKEIFQSLKVASSQAGANYRIAQNMNFIKGQDTNLSTIYNAFKEFSNNEADYSRHVEIGGTGSANDRAFRNSIENIISSADVQAPKLSTEEKLGGIIEGVGDLAKSVSGKKLAMGAVGIAASIMVAGYVGGRPRPADVHAMEEATDYQNPQGGYMLADPGIGGGNPQQGYVVNINARTDKGRDNAIQALEQAIASGSSSSINVAMNITDNYGNINDRQIEEAVLGAF